MSVSLSYTRTRVGGEPTPVITSSPWMLPLSCPPPHPSASSSRTRKSQKKVELPKTNNYNNNNSKQKGHQGQQKEKVEEENCKNSSRGMRRTVQFKEDDDLVEVIEFEDDDESKQNRKLFWEFFAVDRCRFKDRIYKVEEALGDIFSEEHRRRIFKERFLSDMEEQLSMSLLPTLSISSEPSLSATSPFLSPPTSTSASSSSAGSEVNSATSSKKRRRRRRNRRRKINA